MAPTPGKESIESMLEPELVLPDQLAAPRRDSLVSGERALRLAVLEDAIRCLEAPTRRRDEAAREALRWITATDDDWPFSFVDVCEALDIDPGRLRAALLARRERYTLHLRLKPRVTQLSQSAQSHARG